MEALAVRDGFEQQAAVEAAKDEQKRDKFRKGAKDVPVSAWEEDVRNAG